MSSKLVTKTYVIDNMTCVNCENIIERTLSELAGVISVKASYSKGTAIVTYDETIIGDEIITKRLEEENYHARNAAFVVEQKKSHKADGKEGTNQQDYTNLLSIVIILFAIYLVANRFGLLNLFQEFPVAKETMGFGMLFLIGLLTSVHCVAMCGGICLSQCVPRQEGTNGGKFFAIRPSLLYNLGRVLSYTIIGGIVGAIGSVVSFSGVMKGFVQILAGVFMVIMGLNMMNVFPWLRKLNPRMPKVFAKKIYAKRQSNRPFYIGILNGLMPCGPLQAMQLYALSTESPMKGALAMFLFSIGTVPFMFSFGALSSFLSKKFTAKMMSVSAVLVIFLGVFMFQNGASLSGLTMPSFMYSTGSNQEARVATLEGEVQLVTSGITSGSYEPIVVQKGIPVIWTIQAEEGELNGCNNSISISSYGLQKKLSYGDNVVEFTPTISGTIGFSCWMGMIRSKITVVDDLKDVNSVNATPVDNQEDVSVNTEEYNNLLDVNIPTDEIAVGVIEAGIQTVEITFDGEGFSPAVVVVQSGIETKWTIKASDMDPNRNSILFPYYYAQLEVLDGDNPITFVPNQDFDFYTSDSSYYGYVKVVEDIKNIDLESIKKEIEAYSPSSYTGGSGYGGASCH